MSDEPTIPSFNPSEKIEVDVPEEKIGELMSYLRAHVPENRQRSTARTNHEQAAMRAVKANSV